MRPLADTSRDDELMREAVGLASSGAGRVSPNPLVGCLIVRDGVIIGAGYHERLGGPHAEANALADAGARARGATAYVTLEPCAHYGRTPPCSRALIEAGIARVVVALRDPNPLAAGGIRALKQAGIQVDIGVEAASAALGNAPYLKWCLTGRPLVHLKVATTVDGRITGPSGHREAISGAEARSAVQRLRAVSDAVLVGYRTVAADDPLLLVSDPSISIRRQPLRVVLDPGCLTPLDSRLARTCSPDAPVLLFVGPQASPEACRRAEESGFEIHTLPCDPSGGLDLDAALALLATRDLQSVLVEPGRRLATSLLRGRLVDRLTIYVAPRMMGGEGLPMLDQLGLTCAEDAIELDRPIWQPLGRDVALAAWMPNLPWLGRVLTELVVPPEQAPT